MSHVTQFSYASQDAFSQLQIPDPFTPLPPSWPDECGAPDDWHEPGDLDGSTCYDLAWRITMKRDSSRAATWRAVAAAASLQGFHGDMQEMPCSQGLQPVKHKDYIV